MRSPQDDLSRYMFPFLDIDVGPCALGRVARCIVGKVPYFSGCGPDRIFILGLNVLHRAEIQRAVWATGHADRFFAHRQPVCAGITFLRRVVSLPIRVLYRLLNMLRVHSRVQISSLRRIKRTGSYATVQSRAFCAVNKHDAVCIPLKYRTGTTGLDTGRVVTVVAGIYQRKCPRIGEFTLNLP